MGSWTRSARGRRRAAVAATGVAIALTTVLVVSSGVGATASHHPPQRFVPPPERTFVEPTDCEAKVGYRSNTRWPGYNVRDELLGVICVPLPPLQLEPENDPGDYRVDRFTDAALRDRWTACLATPSCDSAGIRRSIANRTGSEERLIGTVDGRGVIDPHAANVDLAAIRRPAFFGQDPWNEKVSTAESRTYTFEYTVPPTPFERERLGQKAPIKLRGWYLKGTGVPTGRNGRKERALVILTSAAGTNTLGVQHPLDPRYVKDAAGNYVRPSGPTRTEDWGVRQLRNNYLRFNAAGFDVLGVDKRGQGYSGGRDGGGSFQEGLDMLRAIDAIQSGEGVRTYGPDGVTRSGSRAARALVDPRTAHRMPVILGGSSIGSVATQVAMNANFNRWCEWDEPDKPCHGPWGHNVRGAVLFSSFLSTPYGSENSALRQGASRAEGFTAGMPSSEILANAHTWPATYIAKGLFDPTAGAGPQQVFDLYLRLKSPAQLNFVRAEHQDASYGPANHERVWDQAVDFSIHAVDGRHPRYDKYRTLREAVAASAPVYEYSHQPEPSLVP